MSKLGILGATALSLALAVATPAFAVGIRGGGAMHVGGRGFRGAQANVSSGVSKGADASYCAHRWMSHDAASKTYMGDDGEWRPCSKKQKKSGSSRSFFMFDTFHARQSAGLD